MSNELSLSECMLRDLLFEIKPTDNWEFEKQFLKS